MYHIRASLLLQNSSHGGAANSPTTSPNVQHPCGEPVNLARLSGSPGVQRPKAAPSNAYISIDQMESWAGGFLAQLKGQLTKRRYHIATIFVDHHSCLGFVYLQRLPPEEQTPPPRRPSRQSMRLSNMPRSTES
jgi:hypothetical protein